MGRDELLKMLDLAGTEPGPTDDGLKIEGAEPTAPADLSETALNLDDWGKRRGRELLEESDRLKKANLCAEDVADFHGAAFEPDPQLAPACTDPLRHDFVKQLLDTPEYQELHSQTQLNQLSSEIAAASFGEQFAKLKEEQEKPTRAKPGTEAAKTEKEMRTVGAVGKALEKASAEVEEAKDAENAFGMGPGSPGSNDPKRIAELHKRVRNNPQLRRICELAGRYRRLAQSKQRQKAAHGLDDVVGVVQDGDVGRLLPHELVKLTDPDLEDDTLRRLVERQAMCREYHATEPVGKGPIVVVVDESGSMHGEKVHTAKALGLALAWVARRQNRWCALVAFSGGTKGRTLALPPGRWDEGALADWLEAFLGGGTTCDVPLVELPNTYWPMFVCQGLSRGKTDIICITDAIVDVPPGIVQSFNAWKAKEQVRMIALIINEPPGDLAQVSDEVHRVQSLNVDVAAVGRALSI